jgi:hypothetical protein
MSRRISCHGRYVAFQMAEVAIPRQKPLQGGPVGVAPREAAVVVFASQHPPGVRLAPDIGLRRFILGVQRVEVLVETLVG